MTINSDPCGLDRKARTAVRQAVAKIFHNQIKATALIREIYSGTVKRYGPTEDKKLRRIEAPWRLHLEAAFGSMLVRDLTSRSLTPSTATELSRPRRRNARRIRCHCRHLPTLPCPTIQGKRVQRRAKPSLFSGRASIHIRTNCMQSRPRSSARTARRSKVASANPRILIPSR